MPLAATPDYAVDFLTQLVVASAGTVLDSTAARNAWAFREMPALTGETNVEVSTFIQEFPGAREDNVDGELNRIGISVITRGKDYATALARAKHIHDCMTRTGPFTANGHLYVDCVPVGTGPQHYEVEDGTQHEIFTQDFTLVAERT